MEESCSVPSNDIDDGETAIEILLPVDDGDEGVCGVRRGDALNKTIDHLDVQNDLVFGCIDEVTIGQRFEVNGDFLCGNVRFPVVR